MTNINGVLKYLSVLLFPLVLLAANCGGEKEGDKPNIDPPIVDVPPVLNPDTCEAVDKNSFGYSISSNSPFVVRFFWTKPASATSFEVQIKKGNTVIDTYAGANPFFETDELAQGDVVEVSVKTICGSLSETIIVEKIVIK